MVKIEERLGSVKFWLTLGIVNHLIVCSVLLLGCAYSGFSCQGEAMSSVISIYTFTVFTPQVAIEVILLLALFLINRSFGKLVEHWRLTACFTVSIVLPIWFML
ncbi:MAG: hypothetical protein MK188_05625 [Gammaproteobacteria bacterium]|nr:hypothetical protein [Gammaproteobacteria bacterium]